MASEPELREQLRRAPDHAPARLALAGLLTGSGRAAEAHTLLATLSERADADIFVLSADADALKAMGRREEALTLYERARLARPTSGVAEHNLAGLLGDLHRFAESNAAADRAFAKGLDAPETWLVKARAIRGLGDLDAAEAAYGEAIRRRPGYADAVGELAQLIWMRSADLAAANAVLDRALASHPSSTALRMKQATLLEYAGDPKGAYAALAAAPVDTADRWMVEVQLSQLASSLDPATALGHARRAAAARPDRTLVGLTLCQALLASDRAEEAAAAAERLCAEAPGDQHALAFLATAWRLLGDPRYRRLYDYEALVGVYEIDTPPGWTHLGDYLADLATDLRRLHRYRAHPVGQSVRGGAQTEQNLKLSQEPTVQAFFKGVDRPIRAHVANLGRGDDPLRRRLAQDYQFAGVWSVLLQPDGFHANHLHQLGWLSSACYIDLPSALERGREGWLKFGEPGIATAAALGPEHFVKPAPGRLVLFPSYMWHGTEPFTGGETRLSVAFDLLPA